MRASTLALLFVAGALAATGSLLAQQRPPDALATMALDEIRPGMQGYGLTVFRGTRPERFDVEVVDVLHGFRPHQDLVLVRPRHPIIEHAGVVGGMSGSPIYINDRLIGAYAYGWEFGRDTVAGVTPIASMLAVLNRPRRTPAGLVPGVGVPITATPDAGAQSGSWASLSARATALRGRVETPYGALVPAMTPLAMGGMTDGALARLGESLAPFGLVPLQAGGGSAATPPADTPTRYEAGGAVAVRLLQGDITGNATGTVTHVRGTQALAFGHPMMGGGETALPAGLARIVWILANQRRSFKISEAVRAMGAMVQDRGAGIVVDTAAQAPTLPVRIEVVGADGAPHHTWNVTVAGWRPVVARLAGSVVDTALEETASDMGDIAWTATSRLVLRGRAPVEFTELGSSVEGVRSIRGLGALELLGRALDNAYGVAPVERVDVRVQLRFVREFAFLRSVTAPQAEVAPGSTLPLRVVIARYGAGDEVRTVQVPVPTSLAGREMEVEIAGGSEVVPDQAEPESLDDILRNAGERFPSDALVLSVRVPGQGVTLRGRVVPSLPGSAFQMLRPSASSDSGEPLQNYVRTTVPVGRVVLGRDRVRVRVREVGP